MVKYGFAKKKESTSPVTNSASKNPHPFGHHIALIFVCLCVCVLRPLVGRKFKATIYKRRNNPISVRRYRASARPAGFPAAAKGEET